jgi:hypothetical protein
MDQLYPKRAQIEAALCRREKNLFSLKENILLYDLTPFLRGYAKTPS